MLTSAATMRIFTAGLGVETNTFSPIRVGLAEFAARNLFRPGECPDRPLEHTAPLWAARQRAEREGWQVVEGTYAFAFPAGPVAPEAYESLRDEILGQLAAALPVDAVAFSMHGAMVADGYSDCEGDLLRRARDLVPEDVVIGVELDPHCHLTAAMVENADAIVSFKEYPHTDFRERAEDLLDVLDAAVERRVRPRMSVFDCRMLGFFHTTTEPMKSYVAKLRALEGRGGVLSISVAHGFPWGDVADAGTRLLVVTDDDEALGRALAHDLGMELFSMRGQTHAPAVDMATAIRRAAVAEGPIVLADSSDNPGGGAPGDATFVLEELIRQGVADACLGPLCDARAVAAAMDAGVGARLERFIGGRMGQASGRPLRIGGRVTGVCRDARQTFAGAPVALGDCAAISFGGIDVVLSSLRCQGLGPDLFTNVGIDPAKKKLVVVKSSQHFRDGFDPIARETHYLDSPGALRQNLAALDYRHVRRDIWPFVENPFAPDGAAA